MKRLSGRFFYKYVGIFKGDIMANTSPVWVYYKNIATGDELRTSKLDGEAGAPYEIAI